MRDSLRLIALTTALSVSFLSLVSCGWIGKSAAGIGGALKPGQKEEAKPEGTGQLKDLVNVTPTISDASRLYAEDDIIWASEDPDEAIVELDELWKKEPVDSWFESYAQAMKESRKQGKPVLVWFTNSKRNQASAALSNEVFSGPQFEDWAEEKVIRLRVDQNVQDSERDRFIKKRDYVNELRERHKVLGAPVVLMLSPRGAEFGRYRGYKSGDPVFYFGRLRSAYRNAVTDYGAWREEYEKKGYRVWHDNRGRKVFAKPKAFRNGVLYLVEPDGSKSKTTLEKLSTEDRNWVLEQQKKKKRA